MNTTVAMDMETRPSNENAAIIVIKDPESSEDAAFCTGDGDGVACGSNCELDFTLADTDKEDVA